MQGKDTFSSLHPVVNFLFFALVLLFSMFLLHPASILLSLVCAASYNVYLNGRRSARKQLRFLLPMALFAAVLNPAFNHQGATILTYLPSGNPLTLESVLYGFAAAGMLLCVVLWFSCYTAVMTSDKFVYLFGRVIPALSLLLSMTLRFVPKFKAQLRTVTEAQKGAGRSAENGAPVQRIRNAVTILSVLLTWALENAIETADSMKSRGYGLPGRSAFSVYRFDRRDRTVLSWLGTVGGLLIFGWVFGAPDFSYYPLVRGAAVSPVSVGFQLLYLALCLTPLILDFREDAVWKHLRSAV